MQLDEELLAHLVTLEKSLHEPTIRKSPDKLDSLLHPAFNEIGRSGEYLLKEDVIAAFEDAPSLPTIHSENYRLVYAGDDVAIVTYATACLLASGEYLGHALRTSVWVRTSNNWQLVFHQGTPAKERT